MTARMSDKEAIKLIKNEILCVKTADSCDRDCGKCPLVKPTGDILEAYEMAISALDKQIPQKPKMPLDAYWVCPTCGSKVEHPFEHCMRCGQKICWEEDEE